MQEVLHGWFFGPFIAGPIIEEALKPCGVYLLLAKYPQALNGRLYTAFLSALGGLAFGIVENIVYLEIYFPEHTRETMLFRYTAGLLLHTSCSFIVGLGINQKLVAMTKGDIPFLSTNKRFFIIPMALHSAFNLAAVFVLSRWLK